MTAEPFRIGVLGHGTVGSAFAGLLEERTDANGDVKVAATTDGLTKRGARLTLVKIYRWALPEDTRDLRSALSGIAQVEAVADESDLDDEMEGVTEDGVTNALYEAEVAAGVVIESARTIELSPQVSYIRRLQHKVAERYNLLSRSRGKEPHRRVEIMPGGKK